MMIQPFESEENVAIVNKILKVLLFVSALNCFQKAEINFPLFLFAIILLGKKQDQIVRIFYLMVITSFTDIVWILLWYKKYELPEFQQVSRTTHFLFYYGLIVSCVLVCLKVVAFIYIAYSSEMVRFYLSFDGIIKAISDIFSDTDEQQTIQKRNR
ncbi:hypothetical protein ABPG72_022307 [Tetrahymena utriculariae]